MSPIQPRGDIKHVLPRPAMGMVDNVFPIIALALAGRELQGTMLGVG